MKIYTLKLFLKSCFLFKEYWILKAQTKTLKSLLSRMTLTILSFLIFFTSFISSYSISLILSKQSFTSLKVENIGSISRYIKGRVSKTYLKVRRRLNWYLYPICPINFSDNYPRVFCSNDSVVEIVIIEFFKSEFVNYEEFFFIFLPTKVNYFSVSNRI